MNKFQNVDIQCVYNEIFCYYSLDLQVETVIFDIDELQANISWNSNDLKGEIFQ